MKHHRLASTFRKVLCTAALAASLTTAAVVSTAPVADAGESAPTPDSPQANNRGDARLDLPTPMADPVPEVSIESPEEVSSAPSGIPGTALDAYKRAELAVGIAVPSCKLPWHLLAGIGRVESVHATGYGLKADGSTEKPIRGPRLDGNGFARILDTDKGEWDADSVYDRAVGPMQFIPSTWSKWGADGNGDAKRDPNNIYDAALAAGLYLCAGDRNLTVAADLDRAVLSYNNSREYVNTVLGYMRQYREGRVVGAPNPPATNHVNPQQPGPHPQSIRTTPAAPSPLVKPPTTPAAPVTPPKPTAPTRPSEPVNPPSAPPTPPVEPSKPTPALSKVEFVDGAEELEAEAGSAFAAIPQIKALLDDGGAAAGRTVVFVIEQDTTGGTRFEGSDSQIVRTDAHGIASATGLRAGPKKGSFVMRVTVYDGSAVVTATLNGAVTPQPPLVLRRAADSEPLRVEAGTSIKGVEVLATVGDKPATGARVTAGLVEKDPANGAWKPVDPATVNGPYFKNADGDRLTVLPTATTDAAGKIVLPELFTADVAAGTYHLQLATAEGVELILKVEVVEAPPTEPRAPSQ
ncbi:hypothetical protein [Streptomyces sp. NPDC088748]|uniref:lytic transglycosylase domain-containing protein n=1 Tax=Streptomyces sp. NPDC088748 TaxID=3365887 RepID=UPI0037F21886